MKKVAVLLVLLTYAIVRRANRKLCSSSTEPDMQTR